MAKYRHVHTSFWEDPFVESLTPEQKYFFLFLMTNPKVRQCGIYQITPKQIEYFSGYNRDVAGSLLNFFIERNKIEYDQQTNEIMIVNWAKFNLTKGGKPMIDCLISELKEVKSKSFISRMAETIEIIELAEVFKSFAFEKSQSIDNKPLIVERHDTYHDTSTSSGQKEKEKEKENKNKKREYARSISFFDHLPSKQKFKLQFPTANIDLEYRKITDWVSANGKKYKDYEAFARNWLRRTYPESENWEQPSENTQTAYFHFEIEHPPIESFDGLKAARDYYDPRYDHLFAKLVDRETRRAFLRKEGGSSGKMHLYPMLVALGKDAFDFQQTEQPAIAI